MEQSQKVEESPILIAAPIIQNNIKDSNNNILGLNYGFVYEGMDIIKGIYRTESTENSKKASQF